MYGATQRGKSEQELSNGILKNGDSVAIRKNQKLNTRLVTLFNSSSQRIEF